MRPLELVVEQVCRPPLAVREHLSELDNVLPGTGRNLSYEKQR